MKTKDGILMLKSQSSDQRQKNLIPPALYKNYKQTVHLLWKQKVAKNLVHVCDFMTL